MKFHVVNLGCKVNKAESDTIAANLIEQGNETSALNTAELIIVNTCTVTGDAEKKTRKAVRRALRENDRANVFVIGCAVAIDPDSYRALDPRIHVVEKNKLLQAPPALRIGKEFPQRVSVKVQDGCDHACTYCIVHIARGKATSVPLNKIINEVSALEASGIREVVLSGIDLGSYQFEGMTLDGLLNSLLLATEHIRFRISSIEPCSLNECTIDLIAQAQGRICRHLHIPLQSGSSKVLAEMNRPYNASFYEDLVDHLYEKIPSLSLSTDIIVGFPGETEQQFEETLELARHSRFSKIHAFRYSRREGTPAAVRDDQIDPQVKDSRLHELLDLSNKLRFDDAKRRIGTTEDVLIESPGIGMSESYYKVKVLDPALSGALEPFVLTGVDPSCIMKACKRI